MPLEHVQPDDLLSVAERRRAGQALRRLVPRSSHADWRPPADRRNPLDILSETSRHRLSSLLPIRHARMATSTLAFLSGSAAIMAADLAATPTSGIWVQSCGDCHMANFGAYADAQGLPLFDVIDFDETLPAPFEWDVKRLATSVAVDARSRSIPEAGCRGLARSVGKAYRQHMTQLMQLNPQAAWHSRVDTLRLVRRIEDSGLRRRELKRLGVAAKAHRRCYPKLLERRRSGWRLRRNTSCGAMVLAPHDDTLDMVARTAFEAYKVSQPEERAILLDRYRLSDVAFKVSGIGSVGTFCAIGLFTDRDGSVLLLQLKEAQHSVLAPHTAPSIYTNQGQRVVMGQRLMQGEHDMFLGWTDEHGSDQFCYVRQLRDWRLAAMDDPIADAALPTYAALCGITLARAHARSGDAARIAGYLGWSDAFDTAVADFAIGYAAQAESDWRMFVEAVRSGAVEAGCA